MAKLITQSQFARRLRLTRGRISQLCKEGVILLVNGKIDPVQGEAAMKNVNRPQRLDSQPKRKPNERMSPSSIRHNKLSLTEVRRDHELLKAELTSLHLRLEKGDLIPKSALTEMWIPILQQAKHAFMHLPWRLAGQLAIESDPKLIHLIIHREVRQILRDLYESGKRSQRAKK